MPPNTKAPPLVRRTRQEIIDDLNRRMDKVILQMSKDLGITPEEIVRHAVEYINSKK